MSMPIKLKNSNLKRTEMTNSKRYGSKVRLYPLKDGDITFYVSYNIGREKVLHKVGRKSEGITEAKCILVRNKLLSELRNGANFSDKSNGVAITFGAIPPMLYLIWPLEVKEYASEIGWGGFLVALIGMVIGSGIQNIFKPKLEESK